MSTRNILETPAARNQRVFLAAVGAGSRVVAVDADGYHVSSKTRPGHTYAVRITIDRDSGFVKLSCDCQWGRQRPLMNHDPERQPCCHVMIVKAYLMDEDDRLAVAHVNPAIGAVLAALADRAAEAEVAARSAELAATAARAAARAAAAANDAAQAVAERMAA